MINIGIKFCPFCGGRPHFEKNPYTNRYRFYHTCIGSKYNNQLNIYCDGFERKKDAINKWNERRNYEN